MKEKIISIFEEISNKKKLQFWLFIGLLLGLSLFMMFCFVPENKIYLGYDVYWHYRRLATLMEALSHGSYPVYLDFDGAMDFGQATKWFYPDIMLIPFAWLGNMTNILFAYKAMIFFFTFLTGIIAYITSQKLFNNNIFISIAVALLYTFALYRMHNLFYRSALAEGMAMTFLPLVFWGLYEIIQGNYKRWYIIAIGYSLLLMTHILTSVMMFMTIIIFLAICYKRIIREPKRLYYLLLAGAATMLISAVFLFPMIEQMLSNTFKYSTPNPSTWPQNNEFSVLRIIWGMFNGLNLEEVNQFPSIGITLTAAMACRFFLYEKTKEIKKIDIIAIFGLFYVFIASNLFPWEIFPFNKMKFIQFPMRFFVFASYFFAIAGSFYLYKTIHSRFRKYLCLTIILITIGLTMVMNGREFQEAKILEESGLYDPVPSEKNYYHLANQDYTPARFPSLEYIKERAGIIITGHENTQVSDFKREYNTTTFDIDIQANEDIVEIPRYYYKGYTATLNGKDIPLKQSDEGLIELDIKESGKVTVIYSGTFLQKYSIYITIIACLLLITYIIIFNKKLNKNA